MLQIQRYYSLLVYYAQQDWHILRVYLYNGIFFGISALLCYIAFYLFFDKKMQLKSSICFYFLSVYAHIVYQLTFESRAEGSRSGIDLIPFSTFTDGVRGMTYVLENVLMFVPLGFLLPMIWKQQKRAKVLAITAVCCSLGIEVMQLVTRRGYFQIDDVWTNTAGAMLGYLGYRILFRQLRNSFFSPRIKT